jgi:tetratricopeptide (TPR) repeat protein
MGRSGGRTVGGATPGPGPRRVALAALGLALAVAAAFHGALDNGFVAFDDDRYITANPRTASLAAENLRWMLTDTSLFYWHPLTYLVHALEVRAFGMDPAGHHATGLLLHAVNAALVMLLFLAAARAAGAEGSPGTLLAGGFLAALLWALHPLRAETVAWASEKKGLLSTGLLLGALLAWLRYGASPPGPGRRRAYAAALGLGALSLAAKPMAMTLPALLLVVDAWPLGRAAAPGAWRGLLLEKVPFLLVAAAAVIPSALDPRQDALLPAATATDLGDRAVAMARGFSFGVERTLWPGGLCPWYPLGEPAASAVLLAAAVLAVATAAALSARRAGFPAPLAAWAFFLVATAPVCGFRQAGGVSAADRFTYLPAIPLFLLAGAGWVAGRARGLPAALLAAPLLLLAGGYGVLAARQVEVWRDSETLWTAVIRAYPGQVAVAHNNLGGIHHERGLRTGDPAELARAEEEYRITRRLAPRHVGSLNNLGVLLVQRGDRAGAERSFRAALEIRPDFVMARANLARLCLEDGRSDEARVHARAARAGTEPPPPFLDAVERALGEGGGR